MTREEAIRELIAMKPHIDASMSVMGEVAYDMAIEALKVERWIPARERLPKNDDWVIVTILDERGDTPFRYSDFGWYLEKANCWIIDAEQRNDVVAWMPLPEPYKPQESEDEL